MKVGIFGGSFDPVHNEHLAIARNAVEKLGLDKLIVIPAYAAPHKQGKRAADAAHRLKMARLAFLSIPQAEVSSYEIDAAGTSYSYLTCRYIRGEYPAAEIFFLMGLDMLENFFSWKNPDDILSNVTIAVCGREGVEGQVEEYRQRFFDRFQKNFVTVGYEGKKLSSTEIRVQNAVGGDISPYVPAPVKEYIRENGLYDIPCREQALSLEKPSRAEHSRRVAYLAGIAAAGHGVDEGKALLAGILHDCAKNLPPDSPLLNGFQPPENVPGPVVHQFAGAFVAERVFGVADEDVLNAIRYHTSGRRGMSKLEKLIFLADLLEYGRDYPGVEDLRKNFFTDLDECLYDNVKHQMDYLSAGGKEIYPLTEQLYQELKQLRGE